MKSSGGSIRIDHIYTNSRLLVSFKAVRVKGRNSMRGKATLGQSNMKKGDHRRWHVVTNRAEFCALEKEWEELFMLNPCHGPFMAWGWVDAWLEYLAGSHALHIVCLRDDEGVLLLVLPLIFGTADGRFSRPRYISVCGYGADCSDHLSCLRHPSIDANLAEYAATAINQFCNKDSRVELCYLDADGDFPQKLAKLCEREGRVVRLVKQAVCPSVELAETWDDYVSLLSSNFRSQVGRHHRRIINHDTVRFQSINSTGAEQFTEDLIRLNRTRINEKGDSSSLEAEEFRNFLCEVVPYMAKKGLAWMDVVETDGAAVGAALNFVHGDTVYYYMGGFAEDAKNLRPGTALFVQAIKRSIDSGFERYDFLRGAESYKYRWGASDVPVYQVTVYPAGSFFGWISRSFDELLEWSRIQVRRFRAPGGTT